MRLHQIDIPGGYSGTVEVSDGRVSLEFPSASGTVPIKRYNLHLLTPDRKNIELDLLRFANGEWCDYAALQLDQVSPIKSELKIAAKIEISKMKI